MSLRAFGGAASESPFVAHFVGGAHGAYVRRLRALGAEVRVVESFDHRNPLANKLRMLELARTHEFDVLVALDCDVVVVGDVTSWLSKQRICAKNADYDYATFADWRRLFARLGIAVPRQSAVATSTGRPMVPYFNSGVMFVPETKCGELLDQWSRGLDEVHELCGEDPHIVPMPSLSEQVALTCAIHRAGIPYALLPIELNFPTHAPVHPSVVTREADLRILHYHAHLDSRGFLYRPICHAAIGAVDRYNRWWAAEHGFVYSHPESGPWRRRAAQVVYRRWLFASLAARRALRRIAR
jgi:hypothetical protein